MEEIMNLEVQEVHGTFAMMIEDKRFKYIAGAMKKFQLKMEGRYYKEYIVFRGTMKGKNIYLTRLMRDITEQGGVFYFLEGVFLYKKEN